MCLSVYKEVAGRRGLVTGGQVVGVVRAAIFEGCCALQRKGSREKAGVVCIWTPRGA